LTWFSQINQRIKEYLGGDPRFSAKIRDSYNDFMRGNTTPFVELLENFFRQRHIRSNANANEPTLQATIELLWFGETSHLADEMHLIVDPSKPQGGGRSGFVDVFVGNSHVPNSILVMELKNVSLLYLWKARQPNPKVDPPSHKVFEPLANELEQATEDQLLDLKYSYPVKNGGYVTQQVKDTLRNATAQLDHYISIISHGHGGLARPGVDDSRICCHNEGQDVLWGYVIICVGGVRVMCRRTTTKTTDYVYEFTGTQFIRQRDFEEEP